MQSTEKKPLSERLKRSPLVVREVDSPPSTVPEPPNLQAAAEVLFSGRPGQLITRDALLPLADFANESVQWLNADHPRALPYGALVVWAKEFSGFMSNQLRVVITCLELSRSEPVTFPEIEDWLRDYAREFQPEVLATPDASFTSTPIHPPES